MIDMEGDSKGPFVVVAIDDFKISSAKYDQHVRQVSIFLSNAESIGAEFKLAKSQFAGESAEFWGFLCDPLLLIGKYN